MKHILLFFTCLMLYLCASAQYDSSLAEELKIILHDDQSMREKLEGLRIKYAGDTAMLRTESHRLAVLINKQDAANMIKVADIINRQGWPGPEVVGKSGSNTLFWVIQHADIDIQQKYLPIVRQAVKEGKLSSENLALLEDRVLLGTGKRQLYGTQIGGDMVANEVYVMPLDDPDNVDKRRASIGLEPLANYVTDWNISWDVEAYKKRLPELDIMYSIKQK